MKKKKITQVFERAQTSATKNSNKKFILYKEIL